MSLDVASSAAILKQTYPEGVVELDYKRSKTLTLLRKNKGSLEYSPFGASFQVPVKFSNPMAGSATYATGYNQAANTQSKYKAWSVTPATVWHFADVNGDIVRRGEGAGSFVDALVSEIENAKAALQRMMEIFVFGGGFGDLASLSPSVNTGSASGVLLTNPWMVRFIEQDMNLVASASISANVLRSTTPIKVTGRHPSAGTIDLSATPASQSWAANDFLFRDGDRQNSATPSAIVPSGFKGWLPQVAPTSGDNWFGVDRSVNDRLAGQRWNSVNSGSIEEALLDGAELVDAEGGELTHYVCGPDTFNKIIKSMQNRVEYIEQETDVGIGIKGFQLMGYGDPMVYSDSACPEGIAFGFNVEEIEIRYAGKDFVYLEETDGLMFRRVLGSDLWRSELVSSWNLILPAPGHAVQVFNL